MLSQDDETDRPVPRQVTEVFHLPPTGILSVRVCRAGTADAGQDIATTAEHPFWVERRGWVRAEDLAIGDELRLANAILSVVCALEAQKRVEPVFNLRVDNGTTFYVGPGALVHNSCDLLVPGVGPSVGSSQVAIDVQTSVSGTVSAQAYSGSGVATAVIRANGVDHPPLMVISVSPETRAVLGDAITEAAENRASVMGYSLEVLTSPSTRGISSHDTGIIQLVEYAVQQDSVVVSLGSSRPLGWDALTAIRRGQDAGVVLPGPPAVPTWFNSANRLTRANRARGFLFQTARRWEHVDGVWRPIPME